MKTAMIIFGSVALLGFGLFVYSGGGVPAEPICAQGVKVPLDKAADILTRSLRSAINHYESQEEVLQRITKENVSRFIRAENIVTEGAYGNTTRCSATLAYREMDFFIKEPAVERFPPIRERFVRATGSRTITSTSIARLNPKE
jgi:hypothetical protein